MDSPSTDHDNTWPSLISGNKLAREGNVVVKRFGARLAAYERERGLLDHFASVTPPFPVAPLAPSLTIGELRYDYVDGVPGFQAIASGLATQVLHAMGAFLRRLHELDPEPLADLLPGDGPVVTHGDFAPYNVIVDAASGELRAVLDWEESSRGSPALDLLWCEMQVVNRFPHLRAALRHLHSGYGAVPDRATGERVLDQRIADLRARAAVRESPDAQTDVLYRCGFSEQEEAAAFVAALSRALGSPSGAPYRTSSAESLVWTSDDGHILFLSSTALRASTSCFGAPHAEPIALKDVPVSCRLLFGAGAIPAWGRDEAYARLLPRGANSA